MKMLTILLTLSPSNALQMLNGKPIVLPFKVPIGTAYVYVGKGKPHFTIGIPCPEDFKSRVVNGKVVAKCEITCKELTNEPSYKECYDENNIEKLTGISFDDYWNICTWQNRGQGYLITFTALTVFDKPMELKEFGITRAPSRWQAIEVGK